MANWIISQEINLQEPGKEREGTRPKILMVPGDNAAHTWELTVMDGEDAADLSGYSTAGGFFTRADGQTVACDGTISGNVVSVTLAGECYALGGPLRGVVKVADGEGNMIMSLAERMFYVSGSLGDEYIDGGSTFMSLDALTAAFEDLANECEHADAVVAALKGRYQGTTLFNRADGTEAKTVGTAYTLADDYDNYDYLEVHMLIEGLNHTAVSDDVIRLSVDRITEDDGYATIKLKDTSSKNDDDTQSGSDIDRSLIFAEVRLQFADNTFKIVKATAKSWTGDSNTQVVVYTGDLTSAPTGLGSTTVKIDKIVGFARMSDDVEIADARVGYDNTVYNTLGAAIRGQVTDLKSRMDTAEGDIDDINDELESMSDDIDVLNGYADVFTADVGQSVQNWLDAHPEATTTVEDHSLTLVKMVNGTLGYVTPEMYGAIGDGETDDTTAIRAAVDTGLPVMFAPKTYLVSVSTNNEAAIPITKSGTAIYLNGATVKLAANAFGGYGIFAVDQKSNVTIMNGQIVGDKATHTGSSGEWGHGISLSKVTNVTLENLHISACWGDGIYIGNDSTSTTHNDGINIHNVTCDGNRRNGMSIIDGKNIFVSDSAFNNTSGTNPQDGVDIEPNDANSVFSVFFDNVECSGNVHFGFDVNNDHGASNSEINITNLTTDGMRLRSAGQNTKIQIANVTNNWKNADNAIDISNAYMSSIIRVSDMYIDCSGKTTASIAILFDGNYQHNIKFDNLTIANGTVSRLASWGQTSRTEASHVNINNFKLYNLTATGDVILVPFYSATDSMCSLTTGNVPPPVNISLPYTAQAFSNYKVTSATENQRVTIENVVAGKKIYIKNSTAVAIQIKSNSFVISNPTTAAGALLDLPAGKTAILNYEDSAATGGCYAEVR